MSDYTEDRKEHIIDEQPTGERWDPLGANDYDTEPENRESEWYVYLIVAINN